MLPAESNVTPGISLLPRLRGPMPERNNKSPTRFACGKAPTGSGARELSNDLLILGFPVKFSSPQINTDETQMQNGSDFRIQGIRVNLCSSVAKYLLNISRTSAAWDPCGPMVARRRSKSRAAVYTNSDRPEFRRRYLVRSRSCRRTVANRTPDKSPGCCHP